jgi:tRNA(Arg) A34 adenosine deaminase TadA
MSSGKADARQVSFRSRHGVDDSDLMLYPTGEPCSMCTAAILWSGSAQFFCLFEPLKSSVLLVAWEMSHTTKERRD